MKRHILWLLPMITLLLTGCPRCGDPEELYMGPLPDEALGYVPYHNGETVRFLHSRNMSVTFTAWRATWPQESSLCGECCDKIIHYETNITQLVPDYPLFDIRLEIANPDESLYWLTATVGGSSFRIPTNGPDTSTATRVDSIQVDSTWFHDVYLLQGSWGTPGEEAVYVDSIWYNYTEGILKIIMSNEEYYTLTRE